MFNKKKKSGGGWRNSDMVHYLRFAVIPLAAVILIAVIIRSDSGKGQEETEPVRAAEAESPADGNTAGAVEGTAETAEAQAPEDGQTPEGNQATEESRTPEGNQTPEESRTPEENQAPETVSYADIDISGYELLQDEVPEVSALVQTYCRAREDRDAELLARLYGISGMPEEELERERQKLELVHASVRSYENITSYTIEGPEPDSYVAFPYFELNYREAEVLMPQLTWTYVTKIEDGSYIMSREVSGPVADYIARVCEREDVKALIARVEAARAAAIEADEKLKSIYGGESDVVIG